MNLYSNKMFGRLFRYFLIFFKMLGMLWECYIVFNKYKKIKDKFYLEYMYVCVYIMYFISRKKFCCLLKCYKFIKFLKFKG